MKKEIRPDMYLAAMLRRIADAIESGIARCPERGPRFANEIYSDLIADGYPEHALSFAIAYYTTTGNDIVQIVREDLPS